METLWAKVGLLFACQLVLQELGLALVALGLWILSRHPKSAFQPHKHKDGSLDFNAPVRAQMALSVLLSAVFLAAYLIFVFDVEGLRLWGGLVASLLAGAVVWLWLAQNLLFPWDYRHLTRALLAEAVALSLVWEAIFSKGEAIWRVAAVGGALLAVGALVWSWRKAAAEIIHEETLVVLVVTPVVFAGGAFALSLKEPEQATGWDRALEVLGIFYREFLSLIKWLLEFLL